MRISKSLLVACAAAASLSCVTSARAADNEAQAKARAAMQQKMSEILGGGGTTAGESETISKARQAMRQKLMEVEMHGPAAAVQPANPQAIEKAREAMRGKLDEIDGGAPAQDSAAVAKARDAMRQKLSEVSAIDERASMMEEQARLKAIKAGEANAEETWAAGSAARKAKQLVPPGTDYQRLQAPPTNLSADKQQRLSELLRIYKADQISPEEYQARRAKILSEP